MRLTLKSALTLSIILVATSIIVPSRYGYDFPREPGPQFDLYLRKTYIDALVEQQPKIVLLGDSTLVAGIDTTALTDKTGESVYSAGIPGSASALWYLILKNNIAESPYKPDYVLVVFRDTMLTAPGYRVHGSYFDLLDEYASRREPEVIQKSFTNLMNPLELAAEQYLPLYFSRTNIRNGTDERIRYTTPALMGCDKNCVDSSMGEVFGGANFEPNALVNAVASAETYLYTPDQFNFDHQVERSYLPDMIRVAADEDIKLIFVRIKTEAAGPRVTNSPALNQYIASLTEYLSKENIPFLDFGSDPRIANEHFQDSIHLTDEGKKIFTQLVADGLAPILQP